MQQSVFNDLWSVSLYTDSGDILYSKNKDVNSMVNSEPIWLSTGSTETITIDLDLKKQLPMSRKRSLTQISAYKKKHFLSFMFKLMPLLWFTSSKIFF